MAVAVSTQNKIIIAATAFFCLILALTLAITPLWFGNQTAQAGVSIEKEKGILIGWNEGRHDLQRILDILDGIDEIETPPGLKAQAEALRDNLPGLADSLRTGEWPTPQVQTLELPAGTSLDEALNAVSSLPGVKYVEPDYKVEADISPQDPYYEKQWFLPRIGSEKAWDVEQGSGDLVVAVLDTGVDVSHPDLSGRALAGYNFVDDNQDVADVYGHGTHVAGIIAASGEDGYGVVGLAWRVSILPVKVLDGQGSGSYSDVIAGLRYAADNGAAVINLSLGGGARSQALQEAVDYARARGAVVVAAAGNEALNSLSYPAACQGVIAVGATGDYDQRASFSNTGEGLDIVAPGTSIYSTTPGGGYAYKSGTSMSTPQVSGAFALLLSQRPELGAAQAESVILSSTRDLGPAGYDSSYGWGLLQVDKTLGAEQPASGNTGAGGGGWYFAEGYTGPGFDTYILLENPDSEATSAHLELFGSGGPCAVSDLEVGARSRRTLHLNDLVPPGDVAARITFPEGSRLVAQRSMYFDYQGIRGGHTSRACEASSTWYFAEGYTGPGYDTYLLVFNPQSEEARVDLDLMTPGGTIRKSLDVAPLSRRTFKLNEILPNAEVAAALHADRPVVAERAMYFDAGGRRGGSDAAGVASPQRQWYFAEGYTGGEFDEWLLLANPSDSTVTATATFLRDDGMTVQRELELGPYRRTTLHVDEIPNLEEAQVSATVEASDPGVVAERAMYFNYQGSMGAVGGGHTAGGAVAPSSYWLVPEGYTGTGFESWILVSNLEDTEVNVSVSIYGESGASVCREYLVPAHSRFTLKENDLLAGEGVSAEISAPDGTSLVVEGSFYFRYAGNIDDGST
jgi:hypothetical protein